MTTRDSAAPAVPQPDTQPDENLQLALTEERRKFQAETLRVSRIFDALDHWRFIADQPWEGDGHETLRNCIREARAAGNHIEPDHPGHESGLCQWHWATAQPDTQPATEEAVECRRIHWDEAPEWPEVERLRQEVKNLTTERDRALIDRADALDNLDRLQAEVGTLTTDRDAAVREAVIEELLRLANVSSMNNWTAYLSPQILKDRAAAIKANGLTPEPYVPAPGDLFIDGKGNGWRRHGASYQLLALPVNRLGPSVLLTYLPQPLVKAHIVPEKEGM